MNSKKTNNTPVETGTIRKIATGIFQIPVPLENMRLTHLDHMNAYLVEGKSGWTLIDTGWYAPKSQQALEAALKSLDLSFSDLSNIIITHCHPDHFGMAGRIKHFSPQTQILMHRWESDLIESRYIKFAEPRERMAALLKNHGVPDSLLEVLGSASMPALEFVTITLPDHALYGGEIIHTGIYDLEVIWTPGHSPGHICLYEPKNKFLFAGDHVLPSITPNVSYHILSGDNPLGDYIHALDKLFNIAVDEVHPGHQYSFTGLKDRIKAILEHHGKRQHEIRETVDYEPRSSYEIASQLSWGLHGLAWEQFPPLQKRFAITETIAHLERMRWEGKVQKITRDGQSFYCSL